MDRTYYLAIDIGASSGRHMLGWLENGKLCMEEIYRFPNGTVEKNGMLCWDHEALFSHVLQGMKRCAELGKIPSYMGIDTWGVDYVLLDEKDRMLGEAIGYRDRRTEGMFEAVYSIVPEEELYCRTGIQKQIHNTVYQLMAHKLQRGEELASAKTLLMMPDFLNFRLTGIKHQEYTNASTTQLLAVEEGTWDYELIDRLGFPRHLFGELSMPGSTVGALSSEIAEQVGYQLTVMHPASHDTASAVLAVPTNSDNVAYLSSGTWSLLGVESLTPIAHDTARMMNYANEGGYDKRYRVLTNIMGLWLMQSIKRDCNNAYSFSELAIMAEENMANAVLMDINDDIFRAPQSMLGAIRTYCKNEGMTLGEAVASVYRSLAECYAQNIGKLPALTGRMPEALHIIGGGCKDDYLNRLTAEACKIPVYAGPVEATAIGNLLSQMLGSGVFSTVAKDRECVFDSFEVKRIEA